MSPPLSDDRIEQSLIPPSPLVGSISLSISFAIINDNGPHDFFGYADYQWVRCIIRRGLMVMHGLDLTDARSNANTLVGRTIPLRDINSKKPL